jgi:hypothetical protein
MENESPGISQSPGIPSPLARTRTGRFLQLLRRWVVRPSRSVWFAVSAFSGLVWRNFAFGSAAVILLFAAYLACFMRTGLWRWLDLVLGVLVTAIVLALTGLLLLLLRLLLKAWPAWFIVTVPGPLIFLVLLFGGVTEHPGFPFLFFGTIILLAGSLGGSISVFRRAKTSGASRGHRIAAAIWLAATVAAIGALTYWLAGGGSDPYVELQEPVPAQSVTPLSAPDPGAAGPFEVKTVFYGSGSDRRRPEFGQGVAIKTDPVDARPLLKDFKDFKGFKAKIRKWYWGFGADRFPINGRVWYPAGPGRFPLVLVVHGNHQMEEYSDQGYAYLGELLASRGFICVSVDENFLNGSWAGGIGKENGVRGWILLQHLAAWRKWNSTTGNPFLGKVDLDAVALIGHSRGREAVALAAAFNKLKCFPEELCQSTGSSF